MSLVDRVIRSWKTRTDDLWAQQEAELKRLTDENVRLSDEARAWESFGQNAYRTSLHGEAEAREALDDAEGEERWIWEGEKRAYRQMQAAMERSGRSLDIHLRKPY